MDRIKQDLIRFMAEHRLDVGHAFPMRPFAIQRARSYPPPEQDAIEPAFDSLVQEGVLEKKNDTYFVTGAGLSRLYPGGEAQAVEKVRGDILAFFRAANARAGHVLAARPFFAQYVTNYNPMERRAFERVPRLLTQDGVLELRDGNYFLTEAGYKQVYGL